MQGAVDRARELVAKDPKAHAQQFENPANPAAHAETTGPELLAALEGRLDAFVTGAAPAAFTGVGRTCAPG